MDEEHIDLYMPIFLQMPQLIDVLFDKNRHHHRLHEKAFWCQQSKLKLAPRYANNADFFRPSKRLQDTLDFYSKRASVRTPF